VLGVILLVIVYRDCLGVIVMYCVGMGVELVLVRLMLFMNSEVTIVMFASSFVIMRCL